jgi:hypothetical protein
VNPWLSAALLSSGRWHFSEVRILSYAVSAPMLSILPLAPSPPFNVFFEPVDVPAEKPMLTFNRLLIQVFWYLKRVSQIPM